MREYFILQFKIINRELIEFGLNPIIGLSFYLYLETEFAKYIY
jgi:hypothetical protein